MPVTSAFYNLLAAGLRAGPSTPQPPPYNKVAKLVMTVEVETVQLRDPVGGRPIRPSRQYPHYLLVARTVETVVEGRRGAGKKDAAAEAVRNQDQFLSAEGSRSAAAASPTSSRSGPGSVRSWSSGESTLVDADEDSDWDARSTASSGSSDLGSPTMGAGGGPGSGGSGTERRTAAAGDGSGGGGSGRGRGRGRARGKDSYAGRGHDEVSGVKGPPAGSGKSMRKVLMHGGCSPA